jgi:hypothetical protein
MAMKTTLAGAGLALLAQASFVLPASAGTPLLSGTYLLHERMLCQASESVDQSGKKFQFTATSPGRIGLAIGTITFTPASQGAANGKVKAVTTNADGGLVLSTVNGVTTGTPMVLGEGNKLSGTFKIDGNTVQIKFKGQDAVSFDSVFGQLDANSIAGELDAVAVNSGADCSTNLRLDRQ